MGDVYATPSGAELTNATVEKLAADALRAGETQELEQSQVHL